MISFNDVNGKLVTIHDHVQHVSKTDTKYETRRGIVVSIQPVDNEATVWFYDTRASEFVKFNELIRPVY